MNAASDAPLIDIENLLFRWRGADAFCLDIPRFSVAARERVFLFGPSGGGKSTLLGLLGGVTIPQRGSIRVLGIGLASLGAAARDRFRVDHIGFIFQQFNLIPYLSAIDNVLLPCRFSARRRQRAEARGSTVRTEALRLLQHLDLHTELHNRAASDLSVGQQQRVAAARALIGQPEIVIADEPTSALDAPRQHAFLELLLAECAEAKAALLFVSHDQRLAPAFNRHVSLAAINRADVSDQNIASGAHALA